MANRETSPPTPPEVTTPEWELTVPLAARLLLLSFRYSQGTSTLDEAFYNQFHKRRPHWRITNAFRKEVYLAVKEPIRGIVMLDARRKRSQAIIHPIKDIDGSLFSKGTIDTAIKSGLKSMQEALAGVSNPWLPDKTGVIPFIANEMVDRDMLFLNRRDGRKKTDPDHSPLKDPFLSHICHYVFSGNQAGSVLFNEIFADAREHLTASLCATDVSPLLISRLSKIYSIYHHYHPDIHVPVLSDFPWKNFNDPDQAIL